MLENFFSEIEYSNFSEFKRNSATTDHSETSDWFVELHTENISFQSLRDPSQTRK